MVLYWIKSHSNFLTVTQSKNYCWCNARYYPLLLGVIVSPKWIQMMFRCSCFVGYILRTLGERIKTFSVDSDTCLYLKKMAIKVMWNYILNGTYTLLSALRELFYFISSTAWMDFCPIYGMPVLDSVKRFIFSRRFGFSLVGDDFFSIERSSVVEFDNETWLEYSSTDFTQSTVSWTDSTVFKTWLICSSLLPDSR